MDIVIKLPDKDYSVMLTKIMLVCYGCKIIELPKGHGRLIDADKLNRKDLNCANVPMNFIDIAQTIIEADRTGLISIKEESEDHDSLCTQRCCLKNHNIGVIECDEKYYSNRTKY